VNGGSPHRISNREDISMITKDEYWDPQMSSELIRHILMFQLFDSMIKDELPDYSSSADIFKINTEDLENTLDFDLSDRLEDPKLPDNNPLIEIICKHTRIVKFKKGDIIIREGYYGNSAFFIASGKVAAILPPGLINQQPEQLPVKKMSLFESLKKLWNPPFYPEQRNIIEKKQALVSFNAQRVHLDNHASVLKKNEYNELSSGEIFGVIAALGRTPRTSTVIAKTYCELLEIRWQGLRDLRQLNEAFRKSIDSLYKKNSLLAHLYTLPLFSSLSRSAIQLIAEDTSFKRYGSFEWQADYKENLENNTLSLQKSETLIIAEGDKLQSLYLVRSGFARVSYNYNNGYQVIKYLGRGDCFGLETIAYNWKNNSNLHLQTSLHALGYADILQVPSYIIERMVLPGMKEAEINKHLNSDLLQQFAKQAKDSPVKELSLNDAVLDFMSDYHFINGSSTMLIDTDRCTRCDDCVTACASGHNNNPRFNRHGYRYDHFMVANACMHCSDPVCMIDCPTGAIQRNPLEGQIIISDSMCIGCSSCANACPYENIRMVQARDSKGLPIHDNETRQAVLKATKCNLCIDQLGGPACERACPHDALKRVDIQDLPQMINWMNR